MTDSLLFPTNLYNRYPFNENFARTLARSRQACRGPHPPTKAMAPPMAFRFRDAETLISR